MPKTEARKLSQRVEEIEDRLDPKTYHQIHDRTNRLSRKLQALALKDAVCTEVSRCYPRLSMSLCRLRDQPDDFWLSRTKMSVDEWKDFISAMED